MSQLPLNNRQLFSVAARASWAKALALCAVLFTGLLAGCDDDSSIDYSKYPVITLNGDAQVDVIYLGEYVEEGATVTDDEDLAVELIITGEVDTNVIGDYTITYSATDSGGRTTTVKRTVSVLDLTAPVITLNQTKGGTDDVELGLGRDYRELGATVSDDVDSELEVVIDSSAVDVNSKGTYSVTYTATDEGGNVAELTRTVEVVDPRPFITTWKTDNTGISEDNEIYLSINPDYENDDAYSYTVDWGDDSIDTVTGSITHAYTEAGTYTVTISGNFPGTYFYVPKTDFDAEKLLTIEQWGDVPLQSMSASFLYASNLIASATDTPDLRQVESMENAFNRAALFNDDISDWDISNITTLKGTFASANSFNHDISDWDTSSVTSLSGTFENHTTFNQDISGWDTSNVTTIGYLFSGAVLFDQDLSAWDYQKVKSFTHTFQNATLSTPNYDALLNRLREQVTVTGVNFDGGCSVVTVGSDPEAALAYFESDLNWNVEPTCEE